MSITSPKGFRAAAGAFGIKDSGKADLALIVSDTPGRMAAMFTTNAVVGAPVIVGRDNVSDGHGCAIVVNSGVANVATGKRGVVDAMNMYLTTAQAIDCDPRGVLPCSTGVIGQHLPIDRILDGITVLAKQLSRGKAASLSAAKAIMTTDIKPKQATKRIKIGSTTVTLGGIAKGSGMIAPNMATMLAFITTDADISLPLLRRALRDAVNADASFNRITVDSDTSTSDTVALLANGQSGHRPIRAANTDYRKFTAALTELCRDLAYQIVSDGEGVRHVIRIIVDRAASATDAERIARSVADSPLVKTAVHGGDPNWGRLVMAVGKCNAKVDPAKLTVRVGPINVFHRGEPAKADLKKLQRLMKADEVVFTIRVNLGNGHCEVLGGDLSRRYITINADYHT